LKKILLFYILLFLSPSLFAQKWLWGATADTTTSSQYCIATDINGNAYMAGYFFGSIAFGTKTLTSLGQDCYLVKYDKSGNLLWATQTKAATIYSSAQANSISVDNKGNIYMTGTFGDSIIIGPSTIRTKGDSNATAGNFFIAKFNANGNALWARQALQASPNCQGMGNSVSTDIVGNVYITGMFDDTLSFGPDTLRTSATNGVFLVKYDTNGNVRWAKQSTVQTHTCRGGYGNSVTTDKMGNAYITGGYYDTIAFATDTLRTSFTCNYNTYLTKYDSAGNVLWASTAAKFSNGAGIASSVITDETGAAYITGFFRDSLVFGRDTLSAYINFGLSYGIFLAKYAPSGNTIWAKQSYNQNDTVRNWRGYSLSEDNLNNIYLSAGTWFPGKGKVCFGKDTFSFTRNEPDPAILLKLDTAGNVQCGVIIGVGGSTNNMVAVCKSGQYVYLGGGLDDTIAFGKDTLNASTSGYPFIASWLPCNPVVTEVSDVQKTGLDITVYPNPSNDLFNLEIVNGDQPLANSCIEIYDMLGEKIYSQFNIHNSRFSINLKGSPAGIYLYRVTTEKGEFIGSGKLIIE
jgi:hypothetical protein